MASGLEIRCIDSRLGGTETERRHVAWIERPVERRVKGPFVLGGLEGEEGIRLQTGRKYKNHVPSSLDDGMRCHARARADVWKWTKA